MLDCWRRQERGMRWNAANSFIVGLCQNAASQNTADDAMIGSHQNNILSLLPINRYMSWQLGCETSDDDIFGTLGLSLKSNLDVF